MSNRNYLAEPINVADPVIRSSDLLSALNTVGADLPQEDPDEPEKWWVEPPGGIFRYTGTDVEIGTSFIGNSWIA